MKKTTNLILLLLTTSCLALWGANDLSIYLEQEPSAACPCSCDSNNDLAVLTELYNNNGGVNWNLALNSNYQGSLLNSENFDVPNAGSPWNINAPDAQNQMGNWHGVKTNEAGCVTDIILWSGFYDGGAGVGVTGNLPVSLNQLCVLENLMLPHNDITGPLPANLDDLCNLEVLLLQNNELDGPLPPEIGKMNNLKHLALHDNEFIGMLPIIYMDIPELLILDLRRNKLEGDIPANIDNLEKVVLFDISDNCFSGTVPATIALMGRNSVASGLGGGLLHLGLQNNKLDSLPDISTMQFVNNPSRSFDISGNHFTFDDIIPNTAVLTKYDNQTLDLDLYFCLQLGERITIRPGFDELIDIPFYGFENRNKYFWARGTDFSDVSNINQILFTDVSFNSAGNFRIEVTNPLAPNLILLASNLVIDILDPMITGVPSFCAGTNTALGLDITYANYNWSTGENTDTIVINNAGTYSVTVSNDMGCTAMSSIEVVESASSPVSISKTNDLDCDNDLAQVFSTTISTNNISYTWTDTIGNVLGTNRLLDVNIPGLYTLIATNSDGCTNQASIEVIGEKDIETPQIDGNFSICAGEISQLSVLGNYASYAWSTGDSISTVEVDRTGKYIVTVVNSMGCVAVNSTNVIVTTLPLFSLLGTKYFCPGASTTLVVDTIFSSYNWSTGNTAQEIIITTPGDYEVTVTDANNCSSVMAFTVEILQPDAAICATFTNQSGCDSLAQTQTELASPEDCKIDFNITTDTICPNEPNGGLWIEATFGRPPFYYTIIKEGDTIVSGELERLEEQITLLNLNAGNYSIELKNEIGVTAQQEIQLLAYPPIGMSFSTSDYNGHPISCTDATDGSITIDFIDTNQVKNFRWNNGNTTSTIEDIGAGEYMITVFDYNNCVHLDSIRLDAPLPVEVEFITTDPLCFDDELGQVLIQSIQNNIGAVDFSLDGTVYDPLPGLPFTIDLPPNTYSFIIQDENNCQSTTVFDIENAVEQVVELGEDQILTLGAEIQLKPIANFEIFRYDWTADVPIRGCKDCPELDFQPIQSGTYQLTAFDENDCVSQDAINLLIEKKNQIYLPTAFSPNGDGLNDDYRVYLGNAIKEVLVFQIGDERGRLLYEKRNFSPNNYTIRWDGTFEGKHVLINTYVVFVKVSLIDGTEEQLVQAFDLLR